MKKIIVITTHSYKTIINLLKMAIKYIHKKLIKNQNNSKPLRIKKITFLQY